MHQILTPRPPPQVLSLVIPIYNEEEVLPLLRQEIDALREALPCATEVVLVNDGSTDRSIELLVEWANSDPLVRVVGLARNFGQQVAITAGLDVAGGDAIIVMDADLQDPPTLIHDMLREYARGYDVVYARRTSRSGESPFKRLSAWAFYRLMRLLVHKDLPTDVGEFRLVSRACLDAVLDMRETHRFLRGMITWVGFPQTAVMFDRQPRTAGCTKYSTWGMLRFAWTAAVSFSPLPLRLCLVLGTLLAMFGLGDGIYAVVTHFIGKQNVPGWTSLMATMCLIGGSILWSIGILGEYVGRIFEQVKGRPLYVVSHRANVASARSKVADAEPLVHQPPEILAPPAASGVADARVIRRPRPAVRSMSESFTP